MVQLFTDFNQTDSFNIVPAVRDPKGPCVEEANCNYERYTLCAFSQAKDTATKVSFLVCMDESPREGSAPDDSKACAAKAGLDFDQISTCFSGDEGDQLLEDASKAWNAACPGRSTIPHTFVNGIDTQPTYDDLKQALCDAGSTAAVCSHLPATRQSCAL